MQNQYEDHPSIDQNQIQVNIPAEAHHDEEDGYYEEEEEEEEEHEEQHHPPEHHENLPQEAKVEKDSSSSD